MAVRTRNPSHRRIKMGRPLKIAKAQAVLTITDTTGTTEEVTISQDLSDPTDSAYGVIAGMPFIPAGSIGGLSAGVTYWILKVTGNSTFTVSATPLDANPTFTPVNLSTATGTVAATVGLVDSYFNNPAGAANTYSVVGGDVALYGKQVLAQVAIGINGTGTLYSSDQSADVFGVGTDLDNELSAGSSLQLAVGNINGRTDYVNLGFASSVTVANIEISNATATGDFLTTVGNAQTLVADQPVVLTADIGGLSAGDVYYVGTVANAAAFSVALTPGGANVELVDEDTTSYAIQEYVTLSANATINATGGNFVYADDEPGFIVRQKGKQKYLVKGTVSGLVAQCLTANVANTALTPNTMSIIGTYANSSTVNVQSLSDHTLELFSATSGPIASGNIVLSEANPGYATFNTAFASNVANAQPYPVVTINNQ